MAIRELDNLLIALKKQNGAAAAIRPVILFLKTYFVLYQQVDAPKKEEGFTILRKDMQIYRSNTLPVHRGYLPLLWLERQLNVVTAKV